MLVTMSDKELSRINVIQSVVEKRMRRRDAAQLLALTERQTQRLMNRFRESGAAGLANLRRGRPGNHRLPESLKLRILSLLHDHYSDFGPTLAAEKLRERHNITVSFYSDKHGIFRVNNGGSTTTGITQFGRVLSELGIELICANSPQAKSVWSEQIRQFRTDLSRKCVLKESAALKQRTPGWLLS